MLCLDLVIRSGPLVGTCRFPENPAAPETRTNVPSFKHLHESMNGMVQSRLPARARRGAVGKALIVWLVTGSFGAAVVAFIALYFMGC